MNRDLAMLTSITIKNFALIEDLSVDFESGFNAISGETGAGKSIIIDALRIALGERIDSSQVRDTSVPCVLEAVFQLSADFLNANENVREFLTAENELMINRIFTADGKGKIKINGLAVTLAQLKAIGDKLVDFHGPHDHQALLSQESHIGMLDSLSGIDGLLAEYKDIFSRRTVLKAKLAGMQNDARTRERELDLLGHQIKELSPLELNPARYEEYLSQQARINNTQELSGCVGEMINLLQEGDISVTAGLMKVSALMKKLNRIDESTASLSQELGAAQEAADSVLNKLQEYINSLEFDPERAAKINELCDSYADALRKFGPKIEDAALFFQKARERFYFLNDFEHNDRQIRDDIAQLEEKLTAIAGQLSDKRAKAAKILKKTIEKELLELGFTKVLFDCRMTRADFKDDGFDDVEFYISPNPGEPLKPLADIISSGESARVMLALKKALIKADSVPVLIFDEIDAQIGGRLGLVTGGKLKELSRVRQVLVITHLAQIASFAGVHYKVFKKVKAGRTVTGIEALNGEARIKELAQMMGGSHESGVSLKHAQEMFAQAQG